MQLTATWKGFTVNGRVLIKSLILKYHKGLIATTCCIGASVPQTILKGTPEEAENEFKWWLDLFGEDYYIELQRHEIPEQEPSLITYCLAMLKSIM
jgi:DNA polymerase III alpha subunit